MGGHREDGRKERAKEVRFRGEDRGDSPDQQSILALLGEPDCLLCREERKAEDRFFVWFLIEGYSEPHRLKRLEEALGFCRRHTLFLLSQSKSWVVIHVYRYLVEAALERLSRVEKALSTQAGIQSPKLDLKDLTPQALCPVCATVKEHSLWMVSLMHRTWRNPEVRRALEGHAFDLMHILQIAPWLSWDELAFFTTLIQNRLIGSKKTNASSSAAPLIWNPSGKGKESASPVYGERSHDRAAKRTKTCESGFEACWSPTIVELRRTLKEAGCPICRAEKQSLQVYYAWLSREIASAPSYCWSNAIWLCREHAGAFLSLGDPLAVQRLGEAARDYWLIELDKLKGALEKKPEDSFIGRGIAATRHLRKRMAPGHDHGSWRSFPRHLMESVKYLCRPPGSVLVELRERSLRTFPCPACSCVQTAVERSCDLLVRGLEDPGTRLAYLEGSGVCFSHLPMALEFARNHEVQRVLLDSQRVRLEILAWELAECSRKVNWSVRYEEKGFEQMAWERAVAQYSGMLTIA